MKFADVKSACGQFGEVLRATTSRDYIEAINVEEPTGTEDELHFIKLVMWCYVFWFEASDPAGKHVASLLRTASPDDHKKVNETFRSVHALRTVRAHNLRMTDRGDDYTRVQARLWIVSTAGEPADWEQCCRRLCEEVTASVKLLIQAWTSVTENAEDAEAGVERLRLSVDREWPAYRFDRLVAAASAELGLDGLDVVAYRTKRLSGWKELSRLFGDDRAIEEALNRAIFRELEVLFGRPKKRGPATATPR